MEQKAQSVMVSICCITYNQKEYIRDALDGFLNQKTDFAYEVLIHDDASTDGTAQIIREYADRYPQIIKPILQTENQYSKGITNISGTYNFPRAEGRYIAMCEGDDYWISDRKLQRQVDFMEAHKDCSMVFCSAKVEIQGKAFTEKQMRPYKRSRKVSSREIIDKTSGYPTASLLFRREMVKNLPDFYVQAPIADIPLQLMAAASGWAYYMDEPMCVYRLGGAASWTTLMKQGNYEEKQKTYGAQMARMYREFDRETEGRYHDTVEHAVRRLLFLTKVNTKQYHIVLARKNREFYRELNVRTRFFIRLETMAPGLYRWLQTGFHRGLSWRGGREGTDGQKD